MSIAIFLSEYEGLALSHLGAVVIERRMGYLDIGDILDIGLAFGVAVVDVQNVDGSAWLYTLRAVRS